MEPSQTRSATRLLLWLLWAGACAAVTVFAQGWPTDNGLATWMGASEDPEAVALLRDQLGGDEVVILRVCGDELETKRDELRDLSARLGELPAVGEVLDPLQLPGRDPQAPFDELERSPLARSLDLFGDRRLDFVLAVTPGSTPGQRASLARTLEEICAELDSTGLVTYAAGHPLVAAELDKQSARVERTFVPLLVILAGATVARLLRSIPLALAMLLPAIFASSGARSVLHALGLPSNMILVALGPLALVLVLAAMLQLGFAFRRQVERFAPAAAARAAVREKRAAALLAALTTAAGFGVFVTSPLQPVAQLGITVAVTIALAVPLGYLAIPPLLAGLRPRAGSGGSSLARRVRRVAVRSTRGRAWILGSAGVIFALGIVGTAQLPRETNALTFFAKDHPLRVAFDRIEGAGAGLSTVEVLSRKAPGGEAELGETLRLVSGVGAVFGPEDVRAELASLGSASSGFAGAALSLAAEAALRRAGRLSEDGEWSRWTVRFPTLGAAETRELVEGIEQSARRAAETQGVSDLRVTGSLPAMLEAQDQLVATLLGSLGLTLCVTVVAFLLVSRDRFEFVAALLTNLFPVACALAAAWLLGFALDAATVMVAAVVLGLAVDNTFHLVHAARGRGLPTRLRLRSFQRVGGAAVASSAALAVGFASLAFSGFAPTARFGLLTAVGALGALVGDLVLLPALWIRSPRP